MYKWLISMSLLCAVASGQTAYTWVDEDGLTHYSDRPFPGADEVELALAQGFSVPVPATRARRETAEDADSADGYTAFNILQPGQQETLWNVAGNVEVALQLTPGLLPGHHLDVYLDGALTNRRTGSQFVLTDVVRGQHTLQAVVLDTFNTEILRSLPVTFMVQQTSIQNPNNPNGRVRRNNSNAP